MKIKTWLLITYLLVMLLPLTALYGLYVSINSYHQDQNMLEYFEQQKKVSTLKKHLEDPTLYEQKQKPKQLEALTNEQTMLTLYNPNGKILYTSNPIATHSNFEDQENL